jgi:predicted TIM-barrel enzyme
MRSPSEKQFLISRMITNSAALRQVFQNRHVVLPVIHVTSTAQALENASIARDAGADGVFLINHAMSSEELLSAHVAVRARFPNWWIGVNCLDLEPEQVFERITDSVNGVWTDNAMIDEANEAQPLAQKVLDSRNQRGWSGLYFGGVAFKYQRRVEDLAAAARRAMRYMDVVTTSGSGTGHAADVNKIRVMKEALGTFPLAIASGITPENVAEYMPHADCFLVATGISKSFEELDPAKVKALIQVVCSRLGG